MSHRALLFDVGNSRIKWCTLVDGELSVSKQVTHQAIKERGVETLLRKLPKNVDNILISNVAGPEFGARFVRVLGIHCDADIHFVRPQREAFGVRNSYKQPRRMGVDRWVALIGAHAESRSALCVVDAGTAVTIDAIDRDGLHLGGQILPGLQLMMNALSSSTADIGPVGGWARAAGDPTDAEGYFATATRAAVRNGALNAVCGAIDRSVKLLRGAGHRSRIVLTGGDSSRILAQLEGNVLHRPDLVLSGLAVMMKSDS